MGRFSHWLFWWKESVIPIFVFFIIMLFLEMAYLHREGRMKKWAKDETAEEERQISEESRAAIKEHGTTVSHETSFTRNDEN